MENVLLFQNDIGLDKAGASLILNNSVWDRHTARILQDRDMRAPMARVLSNQSSPTAKPGAVGVWLTDEKESICASSAVCVRCSSRRSGGAPKERRSRWCPQWDTFTGDTLP